MNSSNWISGEYRQIIIELLYDYFNFIRRIKFPSTLYIYISKLAYDLLPKIFILSFWSFLGELYIEKKIPKIKHFSSVAAIACLFLFFFSSLVFGIWMWRLWLYTEEKEKSSNSVWHWELRVIWVAPSANEFVAIV